MDDMEYWTDEIRARFRALQMIYAALLAGALIFAGVAVTIPLAPAAGGGPDIALLRAVWGMLFASMLIAVFAVRLFQPRAAAARIKAGAAPAEALFPHYFVMVLITGAMLEGTSLFGSIIVLLGGRALDVALALVPLAVMLPFFPLRGGFERFIDLATGRQRTEAGLQAPSRDFREYR